MQDSESDKTQMVIPRDTRPDQLVALIGPYLLLSRIGAGGMGQVYRARDTRLKRDLAIKVLSPELRGDSSFGRRFLLEAQAASALDHPNCCPVYDIGSTSDGGLYIAMAYCEGESLEQRLERGPLPLESALGIARQVAEGLAAAHAKGIVHRDIKAGNVIQGPDGRVRIVDFGIAKFHGTDLTQAGMLVGTIGTMAPEQFGAGTVDGRADAWSLAVLLYEMLTLHRPYEGSSTTEIMGRILNELPNPITTWMPDAPTGLVAVLERALTRDPGGRFQTMDEMAEALLALETSMRHASQSMRPESSSGWRMRSLVLVTLAISMLALGATWIWLASPSIDRIDPNVHRGFLSSHQEASSQARNPGANARDAAHALDPTSTESSVSASTAALDPPSPAEDERSTSVWNDLARAVWNGDEKRVKQLLAEGADPSLGSPPPLVAAVVSARPRLARLLLAAGADPDVQDDRGTPAIILAAATSEGSRLELVRALVAMGAAVRTPGSHEEEVETIARNQGDEELLRLLQLSREDAHFLSRLRAEILDQVEKEL